MIRLLSVLTCLILVPLAKASPDSPKTKLLRFEFDLTQLYLTPEYWGIPPELLKPFKQSLDTSLRAEAGFQVGNRSTVEDFRRALERSRIVALGDSHGDTDRHYFYADLIESIARSSDEKLIATIEIVEPKYQKVLDTFIEGKISVDRLRKDIEYDTGEFKIYPFEGYRKILLVLQKYKIKALAVFKPEGTHYADVKKREEFVYRTVKKEFEKDKTSKLILLYGSWHFFGTYNLTDRLSEYHDRMVHFFAGLTFPELKLLSRDVRKGTIYKSRFKNVQTYYQKLGINLKSARIGFADYFETTSEQIPDERAKAEYLKLKTPIDQAYDALIQSLHDEDGRAEARYDELCGKVGGLLEHSLRLFKNDRKYMAIYYPKLERLARCQR